MKKLTIDEIKKRELDILINFDKYCRLNNLTYFLGYGTLIGAIRHNGFIPWDDDIDVVMPRPDYEKFLQLTEKNPISENFETCTFQKTNRKIPYPFIKILDKTTVVQESYKRKTEAIGIWLDIFPLDGFSDDESENIQNNKKMLKLQKKLLRSLSTAKKVSNPLKRIIKACILPFMFSKRYIYAEKLNSLAITNSYQKSKTVGCICFGYGLNEQIEKNVFEKEEHIFEGHYFIIPKGYNQYLTKLYGNYMELPPENERIIHEMDAWEIN